MGFFVFLNWLSFSKISIENDDENLITIPPSLRVPPFKLLLQLFLVSFLKKNKMFTLKEGRIIGSSKYQNHIYTTKASLVFLTTNTTPSCSLDEFHSHMTYSSLSSFKRRWRRVGHMRGYHASSFSRCRFERLPGIETDWMTISERMIDWLGLEIEEESKMDTRQLIAQPDW